MTSLRLIVVGLVVALSGCGGGGGGAPAEQLPPLSIGADCQGGAVARLSVPTSVAAGRNAELGLLSCGALLSDLRWTQTAGAPLTLMSARSQALSVEPASAGSYHFSVSFLDDQGRAHDAEVDLAVGPAQPSAGLVIRGEPSAWGGDLLSLRVWPGGLSESDLAGARISWVAVEGPPALLPQPEGRSLVFNAPAVSVDSVLRLRATAILTDGRSFSADFTLLVQPPPRQAAQPLFASGNSATRVYPYLRAGPFAGALADCVYAPHLSWSNPANLCTLGRLPLLGQTTGGEMPTVEQVMQRVLVSNDWMAEVFENFLRTQDSHGDFRRMLNATTAVVIGGRVRPSFYWNTTGAIYLDAANLWLTPDQRDTISESADPRQNFGAALNFNSPWRYVLNNQHAVRSHPVAERASRGIDSLRHDLGRILYHELAHAADSVPPRVHATLGSDLFVWQSSPSQTATQKLAMQLPLLSTEMIGLGRVQFFGATPTAQQIAYTPAEVTAFFRADRANDDYNHAMPPGESLSREDAAMLLEEAMMQLRFGVLRDFAITEKLGSATSSVDLLVTWGQRGRIGEAAIRPRLALVVDELMPWVGAAALTGLAEPLQLASGLSWGMNLDQAAVAAQQPRPLSVEERGNEVDQQMRRTLQRVDSMRIQSLRRPQTGAHL